MRRWLGFAALVSLSVGAAGCGGDDSTAVSGSDATSTSSSLATGTTVGVAPSTTVATQQYTVAGGDALYAIADQFCTTADAIVAANGWADGIAHPLYPGDPITVPGPGCGGQTTSTDPGVITSGTTLAFDPAEIFDPYDGDPGDYHDDYGPLCMSAWDTTWGLITQGFSAEQVLPSLQALLSLPGAPAAVPADVVDAVNRAAAFNAEWYPKYTAINERLRDPDDYEQYNEVIRTDPEFLEFYAAYLTIASTARVPHQWATSICDPIEATDGSTP